MCSIYMVLFLFYLEIYYSEHILYPYCIRFPNEDIIKLECVTKNTYIVPIKVSKVKHNNKKKVSKYIHQVFPKFKHIMTKNLTANNFDSEDMVDFNDEDFTHVEKKQCTTHRRYCRISHDIRLAMKFSLKVANNILQENLTIDNPKNVVCSPLSMDVLLNMIALGAKGSTLGQLMELLGCGSVDDFMARASVLASILQEAKDDELGLSSVNALWVDLIYTLNASFQKVVRDLYKAESKAVDFVNQVDEVVKEVNLWAEKESKGLIKELITNESLSSSTVMLLVNALYFKGTWVKKFKPEYTKDEVFYLLNGEKIQVPFMNKTYTHYDYGTFEGCQVLRMLYEEEEEFLKGETKRSFSMYIFLPDTKDGLSNLLDTIQMNSSMFKDKIKLKYEQIDNLSIPKFDFECEHSLRQPMTKLGLTLPFDVDCKDLGKIIESSASGDEQQLYISDVIQKCRVETDEVGTKAVAFTKAVLLCGGLGFRTPPPPINFVADHPFLFMIMDDYSGAILFIGTVLNPLQG
ncbi:serpin-Z10-like [Chenopodium quinoa]|uniref:serpin-Z10-like n=1 Tax=Chenopodium quinoa TaxID=63459 RepID=UPI000B77825B|nr:serpin-Z10-like [Chenopodium quinoa]